MKRVVVLLAVLLGAAAPADRLAALLGDRIAAEPVDCIDSLSIDQVKLVPGVGFLYRMRTGGVVYLNRVTKGQDAVHDGVLPLIERASPRLCSVQLVTLVNENSRRPIGTATLGLFVPYRRP